MSNSKITNNKVLTVELISGTKVLAKDALQSAGQYYYKWQDRKQYTDRTDIMVATSITDGKPTNYRKLVSAGGKWAWCETTMQFENVLEGNFVNVTISGKSIWITEEAAANLPYYYESKDGRDWQNGYVNMKKIYYTDKVPTYVKLCLLNGELISTVNLGIELRHQDSLFKKTLDTGGYNNQYYRYFQKRYNTFNTGLYGQADNPMFEVVQKTGDDFYKENIKDFDVKIKKYEKYLEGFTVGAEIEAFSGFVPEDVCYDLGIVPVKDGSLDGQSYEYITTVLRTGILSRMYVIMKELNKYLAVNKSCALQYHVGGFSKSPDSIVALYKACYQLKQDFFQLIPPYRTSLEYMKTKKEIKDHCQPLPAFDFFDTKIKSDADLSNHVNKCYNTILTFLNEGESTVKNSKGYFKHCKAGKPKWEWKSRYYFVNFLPTLFEGKGTVEFRPNSGTTNPYKALNLLLIIVAVLRYAEKHKVAINSNKTKLCFMDIIEDIYADDLKLCEYLQQYVKKRKEEYNLLYITGNIYGNEFTHDTDYKFVTDSKINIYE
jgi:hypothetical protein